MATHRGRKEAARSKAQPKRQHKPTKGSKKRPPAKARSKSSKEMRAKKRGLTKGIRAEPKKKSRTVSKQSRAVIRRKSLRLKKPAGVRRSGQKASSNPPKPAGRRDTSKKTSDVRRKLVQKKKKKMDKIKSKKLLKTNQSRVIHSAAVTDEDSGLGMTADEDSNGSVCDAKLSRHREFLRGSFPISSSGPDSTRRTPFSTSMEEDSDDEDERASNRFARPQSSLRVVFGF